MSLSVQLTGGIYGTRRRWRLVVLAVISGEARLHPRSPMTAKHDRDGIGLAVSACFLSDMGSGLVGHDTRSTSAAARRQNRG